MLAEHEARGAGYGCGGGFAVGLYKIVLYL